METYTVEVYHFTWTGLTWAEALCRLVAELHSSPGDYVTITRESDGKRMLRSDY